MAEGIQQRRGRGNGWLQWSEQERKVGCETDLGIDRDDGDEDNTVLDRTRGDKETLVQEQTSDREGSLVGRVGRTTAIFQSIIHSSSSSSTKTPTGKNEMSGSHTWSDGTLRHLFRVGLCSWH